jgi:hypothetical protein
MVKYTLKKYRNKKETVTDRVKLFYSMKGFSRRDLFYTIGCKKVSQLVRLFQEVPKSSLDSEFLPRLVAQNPWGHNREIISKCWDVEEVLIVDCKKFNKLKYSRPGFQKM